MARITHYKLKASDTLEGLASRFLGDPGRWPQIVTTNKLRPPFISADPLDFIGPVLEGGTLSPVSVAAGDTSVILPIAAPSLAVKKGVFALCQPTVAGAYVKEQLVLAQPGIPAGEQTQIFFTTPVQYDYTPSAIWQLYPNPALVLTKVLKVGDMVIFPDPNDYQETIDDSDEFASLLGSDMSLGELTHKLSWDSKTHDFQLVKGVANMRQAIRLRLMIDVGELLYHPEYGDALIGFVGHRSTAIFAALANGKIRDCLSQDIRIYSVENVTVNVDGDACSVDLTTRIKNTNLLLQVNSLGIPFR
jgi:hypothetical protein